MDLPSAAGVRPLGCALGCAGEAAAKSVHVSLLLWAQLSFVVRWCKPGIPASTRSERRSRTLRRLATGPHRYYCLKLVPPRRPAKRTAALLCIAGRSVALWTYWRACWGPAPTSTHAIGLVKRPCSGLCKVALSRLQRGFANIMPTWMQQLTMGAQPWRLLLSWVGPRLVELSWCGCF